MHDYSWQSPLFLFSSFRLGCFYQCLFNRNVTLGTTQIMTRVELVSWLISWHYHLPCYCMLGKDVMRETHIPLLLQLFRQPEWFYTGRLIKFKMATFIYLSTCPMCCGGTLWLIQVRRGCTYWICLPLNNSSQVASSQ